MSSEAVMCEWAGTVPGLGSGVLDRRRSDVWRLPIDGQEDVGGRSEGFGRDCRGERAWSGRWRRPGLLVWLLGALSYAVFYELGLAVLAPSVWTSGLLGFGGYGAAKMLSENWVHYETSPSDEVLERLACSETVLTSW